MADHRAAARHSNRCHWRLHVLFAQMIEDQMGSITSSVMPTHYGLAIILMLGGAVAAYVRSLQRSLGEFRLYVAEQYASKEFMRELKREITDSIRELGRRIDHGFPHRAQLTRQQKGRDFSRPSKSHSA